MEVELARRDATGMTNAKAIYTQGGNSKVYAEFTGTAAAAYTTSGRCAATLRDGTASGPMALKSAVTCASPPCSGATFKCLYPTTAVQATYQSCRVGGLQTTTTTGCIDAAQTITITESGVATTTIAGGSATITNKAGRTLQGFATTSTVTSKMYSGCAGCPYTTFMDFYNYYGDLDYADKWVLAALDATAALAGDRRKDVYVGVDCWARGTTYGPGPGAAPAIDAIASRGLSCALFAPAWTVEANDDDAVEAHLWTALDVARVRGAA